MTSYCRIAFSVPPEDGLRVRGFVENLGLGKGWHDIEGYYVMPRFEYTFEASDPRLPNLLGFLKEQAYEWLETRENRYSDEELRQSALLSFGLEAAHRDTGRQNIERFDLSKGCPHCGSGSLPMAPLVVKASALPKTATMCQTLDGQYLVTEPLHQSLCNAELTSLEVMQVVTKKREALAWWQLVPCHYLPPMAPETKGIIRSRTLEKKACVHCRRDNYFHTPDKPEQIVYYRSQLGGRPLPDIAWTWECFGVSGMHVNGYVPQPRLIVSPKVFDVFRRLKVKGACFTPVTILDK